MRDDEALAKVGYEAWCEERGCDDEDADLPEWRRLPAEMRAAWIAAAAAITSASEGVSA